MPTPLLHPRLRHLGLVSLLALAACAARSTPLGLPAGHPADPSSPTSPERVGAESAPPGRSAPAGITERLSHAGYVCPMHPDVRSPEPGVCPKCGMNLVPRKDDAGAGPSHGDHR